MRERDRQEAHTMETENTQVQQDKAADLLEIAEQTGDSGRSACSVHFPRRNDSESAA